MKNSENRAAGANSEYVRVVTVAGSRAGVCAEETGHREGTSVLALL